MEDEKVFGMYFAKIYPMLLAKAERKGRAKDEVDELAKGKRKENILRKQCLQREAINTSK